VNSLHYQAVDRIGAGLVASGHAPDGTVEALEMPGAPVLGVQWHPEMLIDAQPDPGFLWLVAEASALVPAQPARPSRPVGLRRRSGG
jgi:putative glutamine amidotransferase